MTPAIFTAMQATVETLPADAPVQTAELAAQAAVGAATDTFSLWDVMWKATWPVKIIVILLMIASLVSWVIIFRKWLAIARAKREARRFEERFWSGAELSKLYAGTTQGRGGSAGLEAIFESGFREFSRIRERRGVDPRAQLEGAQRAMRATGSRELDSLEHNLELLANIGSTAPYIGLVGTVFGIMVTMHQLATSGQQMGIKDVAPGISEALFATAMGLFVAIPAVWAFNRFATGVERLAVQYDAFSEEFSSILQRQTHLDEK